MKFLLIGDLHGQNPNIHFKDFDAIIAPGDFCSSDEIRKLDFEAIKKRLQDPSCNIKWYELAGKIKTRKILKESFKDGRKILEHLNSIGVPVYVVPGNADFAFDKKEKWKFIYEFKYEELIARLKNIIDTHQKIVGCERYQVIGYGKNLRPEYPQNKEDLVMFKSELKEKKVEYEKTLSKVSSLFEKATKPIIFLSHNVPFNTSLDKIVNKNSPRNGWHYGSLVTRKIVEKYQPLVCVGGHIHEHFGKCKVGKTVCINAGFGSNVNVLMELDKNKIVRLQFHK